MPPESGQEVYDRLEREGSLKDHDGQDIWIHPDSRLWVIGPGATAAMELRAKVEQWLEKVPDDPNAISETFYSRRIGALQRIPIRKLK